MKDINYKQYLTEQTSPRQLNLDTIKLINTIGKDLSTCHKISEVEAYLTSLHLIVLSNSQGNNTRKSAQYLSMAEMVLKTM